MGAAVGIPENLSREDALEAGIGRGRAAFESAGSVDSGEGENIICLKTFSTYTLSEKHLDTG